MGVGGGVEVCRRRSGVKRGGSWNSNAEGIRSAYREADAARLWGDKVGFRVARTLTP